jgi:hypothetical protein
VSVLESAAYLGLSANARSLLLEVAYQFHGDDNGKMLVSRAYLAKRGWKSSDMISKGKHELLEAELIFETVKGHRPNKASWYAVTWRKLDKVEGFDIGVEKAFRQGAYRRNEPLLNVKKLRGYNKSKDIPLPPPNSAVLNPHSGTGKALTGPPHGTGHRAPAPQCGPILPGIAVPSVPRHGHPLDKPSAGAATGVAGGGHPMQCKTGGTNALIEQEKYR